jgi:hypothetical protein
MDEDPSNKEFVLSLLKGYGADEAEAMKIDETRPTDDWRSKYLAWINRWEQPSDRTEVGRIARKAKSFTMISGELYKHSASGILQWCIPIPEGRKLI